MKKNSLFISFLFLYSLYFGQLNGPESIDFDPINNRYLIANKNDGKIMQRVVMVQFRNLLEEFLQIPMELKLLEILFMRVVVERFWALT